jgi:pre-rRNA-processing protein IPI3
VAPAVSEERMPQLQEIVVASVNPTSAVQGSGNVSLYDLNTGSSLLSFKQTSAQTHCTAAIETKDGQGGLVLAAQADKSLLNVYAFQKVS